MSHASILVIPDVTELTPADVLKNVAFSEYVAQQKEAAYVFLQPDGPDSLESIFCARYGSITFRLNDCDLTPEEISQYLSLDKFKQFFLEPLLKTYLQGDQAPVLKQIAQDLEILQELAETVAPLPLIIEEATPEQIRFMTVASDLVTFVEEFVRARIETPEGQAVINRLQDIWLNRGAQGGQ